MNIPNDIKYFVNKSDLSDREIRLMQIGALLKISESLEVLAGKYSDDLSDYVERELLEDIMETSGLLEIDDCDLDKQLMKQRITEKILNGELLANDYDELLEKFNLLKYEKTTRSKML